MKTIPIVLILLMVAAGLCNSSNAQLTAITALDTKQQSMVAIAAFTAKGDLPPLKTAFNDGLNAGLTVHEIKEALLQLYAYTGFPRSLNALNTLMAVLKERKAGGIADPEGAAAAPLPKNKTRLQLGTELQTKLIGQPIKGAVYEFAPTIDQFLKEHLFADIFGRNNLDWKTRELITIAALAALGNVEAQLRSHFNVGLYNGLTEPQLVQLVSIIYNTIGTTEGNRAQEVLQNATGKKVEVPKTGTQKTDIIFATGQKTANGNFTGTTFLYQMVTTDSVNKIQVGNVTFAPGARSNWHYHPGGQILLITGGSGYYQEKGSPKKIIRKGDVINCPPNIPHWHGAGTTEELIQIAITNTQNGAVVWLLPVSDDEYNSN